MSNSNGNGSSNGSEEKKVSAISRLLKEHKENRANKPTDKKADKALLDEFKTLLAARDKAQKAFDDATEAFSKHAVKMIANFGDKKISVGGRLYFPASRGETVFYREQGKQDPTDIVEA